MSLPAHLSYSQVTTLQRCGWQYKLQRVDRVDETPGWAQIGGSAVHASTEEHDWHMFGADAPRPFADVLEECTVDQEQRSGHDREDFRASGRATKANPNKEDRDWWLAEGPAMVQRWVNWRDTAPVDIWISESGEPGIETTFSLDIGDGVDVVGAVDRVMVDHRDGSIVVVDIKSGSKKINVDSQLGTYKVALEQLHDELAGRIRYGAFWYPREGGSSQRFPLNEWTMDRLVWTYQSADKRRKAGDFQPSLGDHCNWCGVRDFCVFTNGERSGLIRPPWVSVDNWSEGQ